MSTTTSQCGGDGMCLLAVQCECECYDEESGVDFEVCVCGHREHDGYCPTNCCVPVQCRNYECCKKKLPLCVTRCHNGMCMSCAVLLGPHTFTDEVDECCVCLDTKQMLVLQKCKHKTCYNCWSKIAQVDVRYSLMEEEREIWDEYNFWDTRRCPLCRSEN